MQDNTSESQITPVTPVEPRKSRFVDETELVQIDLGDGDWVKIPSRFSYGFSEGFARAEGDNDVTHVARMASKVIVEWNLVGKDGKIAEISVDNVRRMEISDMMKIMTKVNEISKKIEVPKADLPQ